ncbi:hypothetical protein ACEWB4_07065 [Sphingobium sp. sgz301303]
MMSAANSRPLRFFCLLAVGWTGARLVGEMALLPDTHSPAPVDYVPSPGRSNPAIPQAVLASAAVAALPPTLLDRRQGRSTPFAAHAAAPIPRLPAPSRADQGMPIHLMNFIIFTAAFANRHYASDRDYMQAFEPTAAPPPVPLAAPRSPDRWRASAWTLWRADGSGGTELVSAGRLGGSQTGLRVDYELTPQARSRATAYARLTSALQRPSTPEAAVGLAFQPSRAIPVTLAAERRIALGKGARDATSLMAVGGFGPVDVAPRLQAEAYAQTGMVGLRRRDLFIDGKLSLLSPLARSRVKIGGAISGGAQPGVSRLDIGPELQLRLPLPQMGARIAVEWRERIAGNARPGSGMAVTLAADF